MNTTGAQWQHYTQSPTIPHVPQWGANPNTFGTPLFNGDLTQQQLNNTNCHSSDPNFAAGIPVPSTNQLGQQAQPTPTMGHWGGESARFQLGYPNPPAPKPVSTPAPGGYPNSRCMCLSCRKPGVPGGGQLVGCHQCDETFCVKCL